MRARKPEASDLGQYFTPRPVIEFAYDVLEACGAMVAGARVLDPACGPGEWLRAALDRGAQLVVGADCDARMMEMWEASGLVRNTRCALSTTDSLMPGALPTGTFDLVVGNPPFGAPLRDTSPEALTAIARAYRLPWGCAARPPLIPSVRQLQRLRRFPSELLFLERFIAACRPGGLVAIILPEGVLTNARWRHVRQWLLLATTVHAVFGLPRGIFRHHVTNAKTCLLVLSTAAAPPDHMVALGQVEACQPEAFDAVLRALRDRSLDDPALPPGLVPAPLLRVR